MKRILALFLLCACLLAGCGAQDAAEEKLQDLEFTVVEEEKIPAELKEIIEKNKTGEIRMTFQGDSCLYLVRGYGQQKTGGYSIAVKQCYLAKSGVHVETDLIGPKTGEETAAEPSWPVIVLKIPYTDQTVIFE